MDNNDPREYCREVGRRIRKAIKGTGEFTPGLLTKRYQRDYYTYVLEVMVPKGLMPDHCRDYGWKTFNAIDDKDTKKVKKWKKLTGEVWPKMLETLVKELGEPTKVWPNGARNWDLPDGAFVVASNNGHPTVDVQVEFTEVRTVKK